MKCVIIGYEMVSPAVLEMIIEREFEEAFVSWSDIDEDSFEFRVSGIADSDLSLLEYILAVYV